MNNTAHNGNVNRPLTAAEEQTILKLLDTGYQVKCWSHEADLILKVSNCGTDKYVYIKDGTMVESL